MKEIESRKEKKAQVVCLKQNGQAEDLRHDSIIEFRQYCCFLPLVIFRKDLKLLEKYKSQLPAFNNDFEHIFVCKGYQTFSPSKSCYKEITELLLNFKDSGNLIRSNAKLAQELITSKDIQCAPEDILKQANKIYSEQVSQLEKLQGYISKSCPSYNIVLEPYYRNTEKKMQISKAEKNKEKNGEVHTEKSDLEKEYEANRSLFEDVSLVLYKYLQQSSKP